MTQARFELTALARLDLLETWNYLAETESLDVADKVLSEIRAAIDNVARSPRLGHTRPDLTDRNLLFIRALSYMIIYRPDKRPLRIVRVLHGSRDIKRLLEN